MIANKKIPALRFPEFEGEWELKKIGTHVDFLAGYAFDGMDISEDENGILLMRGVNITEGNIRHSKDIDRYYLGDTKELKKYFLEEDDIVIGMDGSKVGKNSSVVDKSNSGSLLVQRVARLRRIKGSSLQFIFHHINSNYFHRYVDQVKTSSGIPHISAQQIKDFSIYFPEFTEQQKIASFLTAVDDKIQQLTKKKTLLAQYKKGVMQQIFSQQIRFKDDNGNDYPDWEEKKLEDIGDIVGGGTPDTLKPDFWNGNIYWLTPTEIKSKYITKSERTITKQGLESSSAKLLPKGTILFTSRATIGDVGIATVECSTNQGFQSIIVKNENINEFFYYWIIRNKNKFIIKANGSTFLEISKTEIAKIKVDRPHAEEQQKIANFLTSIDDKINVVSSQLEQTQQFKKGLLQQMFV